eukprot:685666-Rhodomonas_salina.1
MPPIPLTNNNILTHAIDALSPHSQARRAGSDRVPAGLEPGCVVEQARGRGADPAVRGQDGGHGAAARRRPRPRSRARRVPRGAPSQARAGHDGDDDP